MVKWGTQDLAKGYRFEAVIKNMQWETSSYGRKQLRIDLEMIEPRKGETRTIFIPYSENLNSKWGAFQAALEVLPLPIDITKLETPEKWLTNKVFIWEQRKQNFINKETTITVPVKYVGEYKSEMEQKEIPQQQEQPEQPQTDIKQKILDELEKRELSMDDIIHLGVKPSELLNLIDDLKAEKKIVVKRGGIVAKLPVQQ